MRQDLKEPGMPLVRLEVEGMRRTLVHALAEQNLAMDGYVQAAIDKFCHPDNLQAIIEREAQEALSRAIKEEIDNFFGYAGPGRTVIKEIMAKRLTEELEAVRRFEGLVKKEEKPA
ncbi:MAG: hypothetical protein ABFE07_28255 [Armatimonadia bacterium]